MTKQTSVLLQLTKEPRSAVAIQRRRRRVYNGQPPLFLCTFACLPHFGPLLAMHYHGLTLAFLLPSLALYAAGPVAAAPSSSDSLDSHDPSSASVRAAHVYLRRDDNSLIYPRDGDHGHGHGGHHAAPLTELNETQVTMHHAPTPPSYWSIDFDDDDSNEKRYPWLMGLHVLSMCSAFFGALPAGMFIPPTIFGLFSSYFTTQVLLCVPSTILCMVSP